MTKELLTALRAQAQATVALLDAILSQLEVPEPALAREEGCQHPEEQRTPAPVMGHPTAYICGVCHETIFVSTSGPQGG